MYALFYFLWFGRAPCQHQWHENTRDNVVDAGISIGYASFCVCTKCGKPKRFNLY